MGTSTLDTCEMSVSLVYLRVVHSTMVTLISFYIYTNNGVWMGDIGLNLAALVASISVDIKNSWDCRVPAAIKALHRC